MTTLVISHGDCQKHNAPEGHPEREARLDVVLRALTGNAFAALRWEKAPLAEDRHILRVHPQSHLDTLTSLLPQSGIGHVDGDTYLSAGSMDAARRGAGACLRAVDLVMGGEMSSVFCAIRPPGHHAETAQAMGFCLLGNAVIAARHAMEAHGAERVAIVDFDVHHGNGTQDLVWNDKDILFCSTHQMPLYPGSGAVTERGAHGQVINVPLNHGDGGAEFRYAFEQRILPAMRDHDPDLVVISAGFDAHRADPLATLNLEAEDFAWATERICDVAQACCDGRVVSTLEGGYDLAALAESAAAHVAVLMERGNG